MFSDIGRVLISREQIVARVRQLGRELADDLAAELKRDGSDGLTHEDQIVLVPIMTGAMVFAADLIREMPLKISMRLVVVSSYPGKTTQSKGAALRSALPDDLNGRHVVIIDDILDSGQTLGLVRDLVLEQSPASVRICVFLDKKVTRVRDVKVDYVGFHIPDEFVVGYGLDYNGFFRNVPDIVALSEQHQ